MNHVAIMKKSWGLLPKILTGEKKIESRWYKHKCEAWGKVKPGDTVYFKDSGEPITVKAKVAKVLEFADLKPVQIKAILAKWGGNPPAGGGMAIADLEYFYNWAKEKKYCVLIFLENSVKVKPFQINKKGFGMNRAWLTVKNIRMIKV